VPALEVRVDDVLWHPVDRLASLPSDSRSYVVLVAADGKTVLRFGDGHEGARPPAGTGVVRATYRRGIGSAGNVKTDTITLLVSKPLGVQAVTNPVPATGGADRDPPEVTRARAPLAVMALGRLVGVPDYAAFALSFAGIGRATAAKLPPAPGAIHTRLVVTVAGAGGVPVAAGSALLVALRKALSLFGDPAVEVVVLPRELLSVAFAGRLRIDPDRRWTVVRDAAIDALRARFGPDARELAQPLWLSEVVAALQSVTGVLAVAVEGFGLAAGPDESVAIDELNRQLEAIQNADPADRPDVINSRPARLDPTKTRGLAAAQLAVFNPDLEGTLILNPWDDTRSDQ
jgi:predicted phage baseplate assembly protein